MAANLLDLIAALEDIRDSVENPEDVEVRLMNQQNWPFEYTIAGISTDDEIANAQEYGEGGDERRTDEPNDTKIVYLLEGSQLGYGSKEAWNCAQPV